MQTVLNLTPPKKIGASVKDASFLSAGKHMKVEGRVFPEKYGLSDEILMNGKERVRRNRQDFIY